MWFIFYSLSVFTQPRLQTTTFRLAAGSRPLSRSLADPTKDTTIRKAVQGIQRVLGRPAVQARPITKGILKRLVHIAIGKDIDSNGKFKSSLVN